MEPATYTETHTAPSLPEKVRLPDYAIGVFQHAPTKSALKKAIKKGYVTVNGQLASTATYVQGGEIIVLEAPYDDSPHKQLIFPLTVLYEDDHLAAVHKPAGILVSGNSFKTMARALPQNLKRSPLPDATLPQPVHRLDYATTGILLVGKTRTAIRQLNALFESKAIDKIYCAITIGTMSKSGNINSPLDGMEARTGYSIVKSVSSTRFGRLNLVTLVPFTGRTHQLRKHLSGMGNPILGDRDYGKEPLILKGKGMYLHAFSLHFEHPFTGEKLELTDTLVDRFHKIFPESLF